MKELNITPILWSNFNKDIFNSSHPASHIRKTHTDRSDLFNNSLDMYYSLINVIKHNKIEFNI